MWKSLFLLHTVSLYVQVLSETHQVMHCGDGVKVDQGPKEPAYLQLSDFHTFLPWRCLLPGSLLYWAALMCGAVPCVAHDPRKP